MKVKYDQIYTPTGYSTRACVWCTTSELTDNNDGTYSFVDTDLAATFETGSEIVVIDKPGTVLFYDAETELAHDWTATE